MIDPRCEAVLVREPKTGQFEDKTAEVSRYEIRAAAGRIGIVFRNGRDWAYGPARVRILRDPVRVPLGEASAVEVDGRLRPGATEIMTFDAPEGAWSRIFWLIQGREVHRAYPAARVRILPSATEAPETAGVWNYWRDIVSGLPDDDPLVRPYRQLGFVHPESALAAYLAGAPIRSGNLTAAPIFPFRCNLSQRQAVENGLTCSVSVIEGPPGTGKTETILNLVANIIAVQHGTVGVVAYNNAAVDNVREKLDALGFGHVIASLGRQEKRADFLAAQPTRNAEVERFIAHVPPSPPPERLADLYERLQRLQQAERERAGWRQEVDAHRLELRHFERHLLRDEAPELDGLPLLRRSADRILDYLVESELEHGGARPGLLRRIRKYFRYGSLRGLDPGDTAVVLRLQREYYDKRIAELDEQIRQVDDDLRRADFDRLAAEHQELSTQLLHAELGAAYRKRSRTIYGEDYRKGQIFTEFVADYPVLLSTCHSLRASIAEGYLLDYLIIDEASQLDPLTAGLALSSCRNLIVVGDLKQLSPIPRDAAADLVPPGRTYDCRRHSILSSLAELYGDDLPRTLLREHYRCDPAIIGFCNKKFYGGELISYTIGGAERSMIVSPTAEGNHMRQHRGGGRTNQRELDVIAQEVLSTYCAGLADGDIGLTTPYRRQADRAAVLLDQIEADTIHKFQGRQKKVVILTTVLDQTWRGRTGLSFVDDPEKINVAVSRAISRFIVVTNHDMLPTSHHIRDLIGYIRYQDPDEEVVESAVISMFDLLYSAYSDRLRPLAARLKNDLRYKSENITWTVLLEILAEERYAHLTVGPQVLVRNLLPDLSRLTPRQEAFVRHRASVDFVVYNLVTNQPLLAIEVDGFAYHENDPAQLERDAMKDEILQAHRMPLLRLPTTGSGEEQRIRTALDNAEAR